VKLKAIYSKSPAIELLTKLRKICSGLPNATETVTFGHPTFQVDRKTFAVFELYKGELGLVLKVEKNLQDVFLKDPRFYLTPYIGKRGHAADEYVAARLEGNP
jgi:predicted DNA-binding protein (MmcQ/YjbR family)